MKNLPPFIDTKLLLILDTILDTKSITLAAKKLKMSQPAVSTALRSLRQKTNDPLVIVSGKSMVLTERAENLQPKVRKVLNDIADISVEHCDFDPLISTQTFRIASPDNLSPAVIARLFGHLRQMSPHSKIELNSFGPDFDPFIALEKGRFDTVLGNWNDLPNNLHYHPLYHDDIVCLMRKGHPYAVNGFSKKDYIQAGHVAPSSYAVGKSGVVDTYLSRHRINRNVVVSVPFFNLAPYVLLETDLVFTVNRTMAEHFAQHLQLVVVPAPLPFPRITYMQLWHERTHRSVACKWLREQIIKATIK